MEKEMMMEMEMGVGRRKPKVQAQTNCDLKKQTLSGRIGDLGTLINRIDSVSNDIGVLLFAMNDVDECCTESSCVADYVEQLNFTADQILARLERIAVSLK
jgi:hypothetical protein